MMLFVPPEAWPESVGAMSYGNCRGPLLIKHAAKFYTQEHCALYILSGSAGRSHCPGPIRRSTLPGDFILRYSEGENHLRLLLEELYCSEIVITGQLTRSTLHFMLLLGQNSGACPADFLL